tara:strand:+ start:716 stop:862 length:147 start_codon:yes stop_codon:yes gene_type:complete
MLGRSILFCIEVFTDICKNGTRLEELLGMIAAATAPVEMFTPVSPLED